MTRTLTLSERRLITRALLHLHTEYTHYGVLMSFHVPENQSVCWSVFNQAIANETGLPHDFLVRQAARIMKAFDRGEPIWVVILELKMVHELTANYKPTKTPLALAKRVVRIGAP